MTLVTFSEALQARRLASRMPDSPEWVKVRDVVDETIVRLGAPKVYDYPFYEGPWTPMGAWILLGSSYTDWQKRMELVCGDLRQDWIAPMDHTYPTGAHDVMPLPPV